MEKVRKSILNILKESEEFDEENAVGLTLEQYAKYACNGEMDRDVSDTDIDMLVAFCYNVGESSGFDEMDKFLSILAKNVKIVKVIPTAYEDILECDFSSFFKPYNEQLKEFFDMSRSEFDDDEAYYEAVVNLEPLISGNASEQTYKELNNILTNKQSKPEVSQNDSGDNMNEAAQKMSYDEFLNSEWLKDYLKIEFKTSGYNEWSEFIANFEKDNVKSARDDNLKDYYKDYLRESANLDKTENSLSIDYDLIKYMMSEYEYYSKFPEYNDVVEEYYGSLTKEEYNKAIEIANKIKDIPTYNGALELSDNHTLYELKSLDDAYDSYSEDVYYTYSQFVEDAVRTFEEDTGVKLYGEGRSGRHIVVDDTIENRIKYDELKEKQAELEKWVINNTNRYIDAINSGKDTSEAYDYAIGVNELITESADLTAEVIYHDEDGTRDYVAGKLSDGRYFLIGQQEQIVVSDKDLPSLAKKDMDDFNYDEDGDKDFIEAIENGTTLDKNSDIAKIIIKASRNYLDDGSYLLSESEDAARDLGIEPGSDEEDMLNSLYDRKIKNYICSYCRKSIKNINDFDKKFYKDYGTEYVCPYCGEPYSFKDLKNIAKYEE